MSFAEPFLFIYRHRALLWQAARHDLRTRYAGSLLGPLWLFLFPLLLLGAYAAVFIYVFQVRFRLFDSNEYVVFIFCGLIPFLGFAEAINVGVSSITSSRALVRNTLFPIELVPVKAVLVSQLTQIPAFLLLLVALGLLHRWTPWMLLIAVIWLFQFLLTVGIIWIVSSLNVFIRDLQYTTSVIVMILMMLSPISYTEDMIPGELRRFLAINPVYYLTVSYQNVLMLGQLPRPEVIGTLLVISIAMFLLGYWFIGRLKPIFADSI